MKYDVVIIGGGIVGLATALHLKMSRPNLRLVLLEKEDDFSKHQTGHNSGVIHSGLYYKPGSLKAQNCINGYHMLVDFCRENEVPFEICGKIVVATKKDQLPMLDTLQERGKANGLNGLIRLNSEQLKEIEPHVAGLEGIRVPQTGIVDYKQVSYKYVEKIRSLGGELQLNHKVVSVSQINGISTVVTTKGSFDTKLIINCAGLFSDKVAEFTESGSIDLKIIPFRGEYYELKTRKALFGQTLDLSCP
jgi:(S)-2-hydroxyglutarate dehydrogenase